jgi:hypothetical protein
MSKRGRRNFGTKAAAAFNSLPQLNLAFVTLYTFVAFVV